MKIVHICLTGVFTEGWTYQENLLSKYHSKIGHDVTLIASSLMYDNEGKICTTNKSGYRNKDGVYVIRLDEKKQQPSRRFRRFPKLEETLGGIEPDILFVHSCQFLDIDTVVKYKRKHKNVKIYVDNHADLSNSANGFVSYYVLHKIIWKKMAKKIEPYTEKFYGVMPSRVDFLKVMYGISDDKVELLVMGVDDEKVATALNPKSRNAIRSKYGIEKTDFLIVTGGKIDAAKMQTLLLMEAVNRINGIKLIVFGSVADDLAEKVKQLCSDRVQYIGWVDSSMTDKYFAAADLVVFPGRHSVFWEQVAGLGIPMLVKDWLGTHHVDVGGNVKFLENDSVEEIKEAINNIVLKDNYKAMFDAAKRNRKYFMYSEIARRSIKE
nr:glycosyltransferase family 4 protein [uncultured Sellimonas sp.]